MLKAPDDVRDRFTARLLPKLLPAEELRLVAEHCNDRKCAAKSIQVTSGGILLLRQMYWQLIQWSVSLATCAVLRSFQSSNPPLCA